MRKILSMLLICALVSFGTAQAPTIVNGFWALGWQNEYVQCCMPVIVTFDQTGANLTNITYTFLPNATMGPNCNYSIYNVSSENQPLPNGTFNSTLTAVNETSLPGSPIFWKDNLYPFGFAWFAESASVMGYFGNYSSFCMFGMVNYTEFENTTYFSQINGTFGSPFQVTGQALNVTQNVSNLNPVCCIPDAVTFTQIPGSYNLNASYVWGLGTNQNSWCQYTSPVLASYPQPQTVSTTLQILPYTGANQSLLWYDQSYGYYYVVNATNTVGVEAFLQPGAPLALTNDTWCGFYLNAPNVSTFSGSFLDSFGTTPNASCCIPSTVSIASTANQYNLTINYTFALNNTACAGFNASVSSNLYFTTLSNGTQIWQDQAYSSFIFSNSTGSLIGFWNNTCTFNTFSSSYQSLLVTGNWSSGWQNGNLQNVCCVPTAVNISNSTGPVTITYTLPNSTLCNTTNVTTLISILVPSNSAVPFWQDANYPFGWTWDYPSGTLLGYNGNNLTTQSALCTFGMVNFTEYTPPTYFNITVNNF
jgi:hypothetical protein